MGGSRTPEFGRTRAVLLAVIVVLGTVPMPAMGATTTDVTLSPSTEEIGVGETATYQVTVTNASGGVGVWEFTASVANSSAAEITNVSLSGSPQQEDVSISDDGARTRVQAALADTPDTGSVTIATITVRGLAEGSTDLSLSVEALGDESGDNYQVSSTPGAGLTVENANFVYSDLSVTPTAANESATVTASATVTNEGGTDGSIAVPFYVDGDETATRSVDLSAGGSTTVEFSTNLTEPGEYEVGIGQAGPVTVSVNDPPNASVSASPTDAGVNETVTVTATATDDGTVESFRWDVGSGRIVADNGDEISVEFGDPGQQRISVTVVDDDGATDSDAVTVNVSDGESPTAAFSLNRSSVVVDGSVRADASAARDNVGITAYDWTVTAPDGTVTTYTGERPAVTVGQDGVHTIELTVTDTAGNQNTTTKTVEGLTPAAFDVGQSVNATTLLTNESIGVTATVNNTGDVSGTTTVDLRVDDTVTESKEVTVDAGGSATVTFATTLSRGEHTVAVGDADPVSVQVLAPATLSIETVDAPAELVRGERASIDVTVENVGDTEGVREVSVSLAGETNATSVAVAAGATANVTLTLPTADAPLGDASYTVATGQDSATGSLTVLEPANASVEYELNTTEPLTNESLRVTATVTNRGDVEGDIPVSLSVDGTERTVRTVTVPGGETDTVTFLVDLDRGDHTVGVNDVEPTAVTALAPPDLSVDYSVNATAVLTNESIAVTATVENTGDLDGTTTLNVTVDGAVVATETVTVAGGSTASVTRSLDLDRGTNQVSVNGLDPTAVEVRKPADVNVVAQNVTTTEFLSTEPLNVTVYLNNTGDLNGSVTVPLTLDGETIASKTVTVPSNTVGSGPAELSSVSFSQARNWESYGEHLVSAGNATAETVTVLRPTNPEATVSITTPTVGAVANSSAVTIAYETTNTSTGVDAVELRVDDGRWEQQPLDGGSVEAQLEDGESTVDVRVIDNLGNTIATDSTRFVVDTQAPNASLTVTGPASTNDEADITVTSEDRTLNTTVLEVRNELGVLYRVDLSDEIRSSAASGGGTTGEALTSWDGTDLAGQPVPSGTYTVAVVTTDEAGYTTETTTTVVVDNDRPNVSITNVSDDGTTGPTLYVNDSDTVSLTLDASDPTTNVTQVSAVVQARTSAFQTYVPSASTDGGWTASVDVSNLGGSGNYSVGGLATDEAQNVGFGLNGSVTVVVDETAPTMGATVSQVDQSTGRVNVTASETLAGVPNATVYLPDGTPQSVSLSATDRGWTGTFDLPGDGSYQVVVSGTDRAGNTGQTRASTKVQTDVNTVNRTVTIENDRTGTFIELHTETDVNRAFAALTESDSPLATLSENLTGSQFIDGQLGAQLNDNLSYAVIGMPVNESRLPDGVQPEDVEIRFYNETTDDWEVVGETNLEEREFNGTTTQFYTVNVSHFSTYGAVAPDTTPPSVGDSSLSPTGPSYDYGTEQVSVQFDYRDEQTGVDTSAVRVWVDGRLVSDGQSFDGTVQVTSTSTTVELTELVGSGEHSVTVQVVDEAGNPAANVTESFTIARDTAAPTLSTSFGTDRSFDYGTSEVSFAVDLTDSQSGINASGITVTVDGVDVTEAATVTDSAVSHTATGLAAGTHSFTVTVPDQEGNVETLTRTFSIAGDTAAPTIERASVSPSVESGLLPADTTQLSLSASYDDTESAVVAGDVTVEFDDGSGWTDVTDTAVVTTRGVDYTAYDLTPGTYAFRLTVPDAEGNTRTITREVTIGTGTAPTVTDVSLSPTAGDGPLPSNTSRVTIDLAVTDEQGDIDSTSATFDGESVPVSRSDGEISYTATGLAAGTNHTLTVTVTDRGGNTVTETVRFEIAAEPPEESDSDADDGTNGGGGGGGGAGGGGGGGRSAELSLSVTPVSDGATIQISDAAQTTSGTADLGDAVTGAGVTVESVGIEMLFDGGRFRIELSTPTDGGAAPQGSTVASFDADVIGTQSANFESRTITFSVDDAALPDGTTLGDVALYVRSDGGWERVSVSQDGDSLTASPDTFGTFAVSVLSDGGQAGTDSASPTPTATATPTPTVTDSPTESGSDADERTESPTATSDATETSTPGFGPLQAIVAAVAALLLLRRRED